MFSSQTPLQQLNSALAAADGVQIFVKREDIVHPTRSGNKFYKLITNISTAKRLGCRSLISFGGGYSNHLHALAAAGQEEGIATVGIVRGDYSKRLTPTLTDCQALGMQLCFVNRKEWALRNDQHYLSILKQKYRNPWVIPEGGNNLEGYRGACLLGEAVANQLPPNHAGTTHVVLATATGTTMAGVVSRLPKNCVVHGISVLKGQDTLTNEVLRLTQFSSQPVVCNWHVDSRFHCGGYARAPDYLLRFIRFFERKFAIPLDPVYTAKVMFGVFKMLNNGELSSGDKVVVIHTGGLQGRRGYPELTGGQNWLNLA